MFFESLQALAPRLQLQSRRDVLIGRIGNHLELIYDDALDYKLVFVFRLPKTQYPRQAIENLVQSARNKGLNAGSRSLKMPDPHTVVYELKYGLLNSILRKYSQPNPGHIQEFTAILQWLRDFTSPNEFSSYAAEFRCDQCGSLEVQDPVSVDFYPKLLCPACLSSLAERARQKELAHENRPVYWKGSYLYGGVAALCGMLVWFWLSTILNRPTGGIHILLGYIIGAAVTVTVIKSAGKYDPELRLLSIGYTLLAGWLGRLLFLQQQMQFSNAMGLLKNSLFTPEEGYWLANAYLAGIFGVFHWAHLFSRRKEGPGE